MDTYGFAGKILHVDLTTGETRAEPLDVDVARKFVGGRGMNHKLAYDLIPPDVDPLAPENPIILGAGPFSGTVIPGCCELTVTTKFPINGAIATGSGAGKFSLMMKTSGYDHLIISGKAESAVYLKICDDVVELCDASDLWGKDGNDTVDLLRERHEPCSIIPIGQAGENLVKVSVSQIDKGGTLGSGGLPAIMGAKNLKAIVAVQGTHGIKVADRKAFTKTVQGLLDRMMPWKGRDMLLRVGFSGEVSSSQFATFPYDNWSKVDFNEFTMEERKQILGLHAKSNKTLACPGCPMADKDRIRITEGKNAGVTGYVTGMILQRHGAEDIDEAYARSVRYSDLLNRYGLCELNFDFTFSLMAHLYSKGVITIEDTGIELKDDFETRLKVAEMTAKREGFGDILAEGTLEAARKLGRGIEEDYAVHIKGRTPHLDPRTAGLGTMPLTQLTDPRGAYPAGGGGPGYVPGKKPSEFARHGERMGIPPDAIDRIVSEDSWNVGRFTRYSQDWYSLWDSLGMCLRAPVSRFFHINTISELYSALTNIETPPSELMKAAERAWNLHRMLNGRVGFSRKHDKAPKKWFQTLSGPDGEEYPLKDYYGKIELKERDIEKALDDYYDERGWDKETGLPTPEKLKELGLDDLSLADM
ncbi:MAG: aldehyde ferredoxin oxidoreductase C-terminal domain-containing protein [Desulfatiglans sp.]|nr:aldehyde ferredoxin oxidoreductase C-terminal domain-containing protein [Thermodesulfobacteriota bacterium]MEE4353074.1 aldehyde ferredoxin oxidoreductase C-terminal domain-containing protein [Desulfatiglans sp.]